MGKRRRLSPEPQARPDLIFARQPEALPLVLRQLQDYHRRYQGGDRAALLLALDLFLECFNAPKWIANGFFDAMSDWLAYRAATLDEAFGVQRTGEHIDQHREREALRPLIMLRLAELQQQENAPIDSGTFARVANEIGKSTSYVSGVYYERASSGWRKLAKLRVKEIEPEKGPEKTSTKATDFVIVSKSRKT